MARQGKAQKFIKRPLAKLLRAEVQAAEVRAAIGIIQPADWSHDGQALHWAPS